MNVNMKTKHLYIALNIMEKHFLFKYFFFTSRKKRGRVMNILMI